jgi:RNA polymerase sigma-70 factor (ECF subfamily)
MTAEPTLRALFDAEYRGLVRLATTIVGDRSIAEEIVQEAFARALARWRRLRHYERPGAWLRLVTVRMAVRSRARQQREVQMWDVPDRDSPEVAGSAFDVLQALSDLTPMQRAAIALFYFDDLPVDEIANLLGIAPATTRSHLHRGRAALAQLLAGTADTRDGSHVD